MIVKKKLRSLLKNESGQSTAEYILILAVVVMIALKFKDKIGKEIERATEKIGSTITDSITNDLN